MSRGIFLAAAATLTVLSSWTAVSAMPAFVGASLQPGEAAITKVQYYSGYDYGSPLDLPAAVIGGTLGLVTGAFNAPTYDAYCGGPSCAPSYADRVAACAANFVSFDPFTGTYTTYEGFQVLCPFLR
jgi:hypothetical protein